MAFEFSIEPSHEAYDEVVAFLEADPRGASPILDQDPMDRDPALIGAKAIALANAIDNHRLPADNGARPPVVPEAVREGQDAQLRHAIALTGSNTHDLTAYRDRLVKPEKPKAA